MDYYDMLEQVDALAMGLSHWETEFVESLMEGNVDGSEPTLSEKQQAVIERLYEKHVINRGVEL